MICDFVLLNKLSYFLNKFFFCTVCVAVVLIHYVSLTVNDKGVRYHLYAECTFEVRIWVKKHLIFPALTVNKRLYLVDILCLVYRDSDNLYASLLLPISINLCNSIKFAIARMAPSCKEVNDKWFAIVRERVCLDGFAVNALYSNRREFRSLSIRSIAVYN